MMHDMKSASSDSDSANNSPSFQQYSIQTDTPANLKQQFVSANGSPAMKRTPLPSLTDSSESELEASPDFPRFRPGLLSEQRSNIDKSPGFPIFRPGLLASEGFDAKTSSLGFRQSLENPTISTNTTSPDFSKFRLGSTTQQNQASASISLDSPPFTPGPRLLPQNDQESTNTSPDFPKFRPGLINGPSPSATWFKLQSPPSGHRINSTTSDLHSNPVTFGGPASPPGYIAPHLKCPVSPLARTSSQAKFPHIRSILKAPSGGHTLVNQQSKPMGSPLMRRVIQHNADRLRTRKGATATDDEEDSKSANGYTLPDEPFMKGGIVSPTSPSYLPQSLLANSVTEFRTEELRNSPSYQNIDSERTSESVDNFPCSLVQSPLTSPENQDVKMNTSSPPHIHFVASAAIDERLHVKSGENKDDSGGTKKDDTRPLQASPSVLYVRPSPPTLNQAGIPPKPTTPRLPRDVRPHLSASVSPKIPMRYSRRKSVTFEGELVHTGPLRLHHSRKSLLSPISSRYNKRRRSISTVAGHKQKDDHRMLRISPHLPSHVYRKVSMSPRHSRPFVLNKKLPPLNQTKMDEVKVTSPHHQSHLYRNDALPNYERRRSITIGQAKLPTSIRNYKRRKSVSILARSGVDSHTTTSPRHRKHPKSVSGVNGSKIDSSSALLVNSRYYRRRKSLAGATHLEVSQNKDVISNSRYYRRRRSEAIMSQYQHNKLVAPSPRLPVHIYRHISQSPTRVNRTHTYPKSITQYQNETMNYHGPNIPSMNVPMSPINYKRRKSIASLQQELRSQHGSLTPKSPGHRFRKHLPSPFPFGRKNRRKSVLVINQGDHLIPLTSPMFNRITLGAYQRSLPSTPLPRRYTRRKSLSVITPRTRRRIESDEQIQVTLEAARFDVTSIYSTKSFLSLAPTEISKRKTTATEEKPTRVGLNF